MYVVRRYLNNDQSLWTACFETETEAKKLYKELIEMRKTDFKEYVYKETAKTFTNSWWYIKLLYFKK